MTRKVIRQGNNTLTLTLPRGWTEQWGVKAGDDLSVAEHGKDLVISTSSMPAPSKAEVDITGMDGSSILLLIRGLYRRGYDTIILTTKDNMVTHLRDDKRYTVEQVINSEITRLMAFELFYSSKNRFELKSISAEQIEDFDTVLRRIFLLTLQYYDDYRKALQTQDPHAMELLFEKPVSLTKCISYASRLLNKKGHTKFDYSPFLYHLIETLELITDNIKIAVRFPWPQTTQKQYVYEPFTPSPAFLKSLALFDEALRMYYESYYKFSLVSLSKFIAHQDKFVRLLNTQCAKLSRRETSILLLMRMIPDFIRESLRIRASLL